ncbi:MAG: hypothetical protein J0665_11855, partial [Deltaproteobacteria bacterium]|nr:hypothetical protein [Deltaproteobacteria bacterium]
LSAAKIEIKEAGPIQGRLLYVRSVYLIQVVEENRLYSNSKGENTHGTAINHIPGQYSAL